MPLHKIPLIMGFNVQENAVFIHKFSKISLPCMGGGIPSSLSLLLPPMSRVRYETIDVYKIGAKPV